MYNDKYVKTRMKIYNDRLYTNFQHNKLPKDNEYCACLSVILLDSIFVNLNKEYYLQNCIVEMNNTKSRIYFSTCDHGLSFSPSMLLLIFLEECKYTIQDRKIVNTTNKELNITESDDESDE